METFLSFYSATLIKTFRGRISPLTFNTLEWCFSTLDFSHRQLFISGLGVFASMPLEIEGLFDGVH